MKYIGGVDVKGKDIKIKRLSNNKWYSGEELISNIVGYISGLDNGKLRTQFISEYIEIKKVYSLFSIKAGKDLFSINLKDYEIYTTGD